MEISGHHNQAPSVAGAGLEKLVIYIAVFILSASLASAGSNQGRCEISSEVSALENSLLHLARRQGNLGLSETVKLRSALAAINPAALGARLRAVGLDGQGQAVMALMAEARQIAQDRYLQAPSILRKRLGELARLTTLVCEKESALSMREPKKVDGGNPRMSSTAETDGVASASQSTGTRGERSGGTASSLERLVVLWGWLGGAVGIILALRFAALAMVAMRYSRQRCLIPATIASPIGNIQGEIWILGLQGCRYFPRSSDEVKQQESALLGSRASLQIAGRGYPVKIDTVHHNFTVLYFTHALTRRLQNRLLRASKITPQRIVVNTRGSKGRWLRLGLR